MIKQEDVYKIGKIGKPHGINGELSFMFDDDIFDRVDFDYLILMIKGILVPFFMEAYVPLRLFFHSKPSSLKHPRCYP